MDSERFDRFAKAISELTSRRSVLRGVAAGGLGAALGLSGILTGFEDADAKSKKKKRKRRKRRRRRNKKKQCNFKGRVCATPLNPCETVTCEKNKCVPGTAPNGTVCGQDLVCQSGACVCPNGVCTVRVRPSNLSGWLGYDDAPGSEKVDNSFLNFVTGPGSPPYGPGSVGISVTGTQRYNLATYQFAGIRLADITELKYTTYNPSAGNGGSADRSGYILFNVDFFGSDTWQRRLNWVPSQNGTVTQNTWQEWDAIAGGAGKWQYSGPNWPLDNKPGTTLKTWSEILAQYPDIRIRVTDAFFGFRVGEPYADGYTENFNSVTLGTGSGTTRFVFQPD